MNLLHKALNDKFKFRELEPIFLEVQLADGSIKQPLGILEDVMVRVEQCVFPVDFIVAQMSVPDHLSRAPVILGRPFQATSRAVTDWEKGLVVLRVGEESVELNISRLMKYPSSSYEDVGTLDLVEDDFDSRENFLEIFGVDQLEKLEEPIDPLLSSDIELKTLPSSLKYAFLGPKETLPMFISSSLTPCQEESLMCVLREHRAAIGWSFDDIKGVPSRVCEHRIFIEEGAKPSRESQRRINPDMLEVHDVSFSCVVKTQRRWSNKIYKTELTKTRYNNQVLGKYWVDPQRAGLTLIAELTWSNLGLKGVLNKRK